MRFIVWPAHRFGLALARYADPIVRDGVITSATLDAEAAGRKVATLSAAAWEPEERLLGRLKEAAAPTETDASPDALFVTGLESLVSDPAGRPLVTPAIDGLNRQRDLLPGEVGVPIVLWLTDSASEAFRRVARDLYDVVLTFFTFDAREWPRAISDRKSTRLNSSHSRASRMPSSA